MKLFQQYRARWEEKTLFPKILHPLSICFSSLIFLRKKAYLHGIFSSYRPLKPVVSVGNISLGGSGKTPFVILLIEHLSGIIPGILSRGYKRSSSVPQKVEVDDQFTEVGDEPLLLKRLFPKIPVVVSKKRSKGIGMLREVDIIILDDGMQHLAIKRDLEIVVINVRQNLFEEHLLPFGRLREPLESLQRADYIILHHIDSKEEFHHFESHIRKYTDAPCIGTSMKIDLPIQERIAAFCGIGHPQGFFEMLTHKGCQIVATWTLEDHQPPDPHHLLQFMQMAATAGAQAVVCTEKDWVKINTSIKFPVPLIPLHAEMQIVAGTEHFSQLLQTIRELVDQYK